MTTYLGTATGTTPGVEGDSTTANANGVKGSSTTGASAVYGTTSGSGAGIHGNTSGAGWAVYGYSSDGGGSGIGTYGRCDAGYGVFGTSSHIGTYGTSGGTNGYALYGSATASGSYGLYATGYTYGVYGTVSGTGGYAGYFLGAVYVSGALTKAGGGFLIDHPLDPANKLCEHSFVESPDRKNVYDGVATADASGEFTVQLPSYFEALNTDFRYQLTPIGGAAPDLHVKQEIKNGSFAGAGAKAGQKISWQVTGVRKDAWAAANPLVAERDKAADHRGKFLNPEAHGQSADKGVHPKGAPPPPAQKVLAPTA